MKDRRRARTQRLQEAHNVELAHELRNQQLERDAAAKTSTEQLQKQLLGEALKGKGKQEVEDVMYALLRQRHIMEAVHLEGQLEKERSARLAEARAEVVEARAAEREKLQTAFDQVRQCSCTSV